MKGIIRTIFLLAVVIAVVAAYMGHKVIYGPFVQPASISNELFIHSDDKRSDVFAKLETSSMIQKDRWLPLLADRMSYLNPKAGRYVLEKGWSRYKLLQVLRSGDQMPVRVVVNGMRTLEELSDEMGRQLEPSSAQFLTTFRDPELHSSLGLSQENFISLFIPNTYEVFWTTSPLEFIDRMNRENDNFWNQKRIERAEKMNLSRAEVYTLASIVEKETNQGVEKPAIAGVYLNRISLGMPLQADPTIVFASGDFTLRRILHKHLEIESPYNTYKYKGLPPGPICIPSIQSIDAILQAEDHDYIFFCAMPDNSGLHAFASNLRDHNKNARRFHAWLNQRGVK